MARSVVSVARIPHTRRRNKLRGVVMPIVYRVVAVNPSEEDVPPDPDEEWVQDGVNYPEGTPPPGVMSSTEVVPELRLPNHVAPEPLPLPMVVEEPGPTQPTGPPYEPPVDEFPPERP